MSGATFSRLKNWTTEVLSHADLNAEIDNILNNLGPQGVGGYSATAAQMKITTAPGSTNSESLATSLAGELERIRYVLKDMKGANATNWYDSANTTLTDLLTATGGSLATNRLASGPVSANSGASRFLIPAGTSANLTVSATSPLVYYINSVQYSITAALTLSSLSTSAGGSNDTAGVADATLSAQDYTQWLGEDGSVINMSAVGSNISSLVNQYAAFKLTHGGSTEFFTGFVDPSGTKLTNCYRGFFFNNAQSPVVRLPISNSDPIQLMKLTWLFANTAAGVIPSYNYPQVSYATPSSTSVYWFDMTNNLWKTYNGAAWTAAGATLIGVCAQDTTACKVARSFMYAANYDAQSNMILDWVSGNILTARNPGSKVGVASTILNFNNTKPAWDITTAIESGYAASASTTYWSYIGESGQLKLSPVKPYFSFDQARGWYHPYENWRAVGYAKTDATTAFDTHSLFTYRADPVNKDFFLNTWAMQNIGVSTAINGSSMVVTVNGADGTELSPGNPAYVNFRSPTNTSGTMMLRRITKNLNITIPVGATLGTYGGNMNQYLWAYIIDNNGTSDVALTGGDPVTEYGYEGLIAISSSSTVAATPYSNINCTPASVRLCASLLVNQTNAGTWTVNPSVIAIQPTPQYNITNWANNLSFTPNTAAWVGLTQAEYWTRRVGDTLEAKLTFKCTSNGASTAFITLPYSADTTKLNQNGNYRQHLGDYHIMGGDGGAYAYTNGTAAQIAGIVGIQTATSTRLLLSFGGTNADFASLILNSVAGTGQVTTIKFAYPVAGWSAYGP